jgi:hypothetical protein
VDRGESDKKKRWDDCEGSLRNACHGLRHDLKIPRSISSYVVASLRRYCGLDDETRLTCSAPISLSGRLFMRALVKRSRRRLTQCYNSISRNSLLDEPGSLVKEIPQILILLHQGLDRFSHLFACLRNVIHEWRMARHLIDCAPVDA